MLKKQMSPTSPRHIIQPSCCTQHPLPCRALPCFRTQEPLPTIQLGFHTCPRRSSAHNG